jgi:hypothetical protein
MDILKTYFVRVDTINDKDPTAQEIRFNNIPIWKVESGAVPNSDKITDVEPDTNVDNNPITIKNDNTMMTGISSNSGKDSFSIENPSDKTKKNYPLNNVSPQDTDNIGYDDIYTNNINSIEPTDKKINSEQKKMLDSIPRPPNSFMRPTETSLGRERTKIPSKTEVLPFKGGKSRRSATRKNKKKTKTMRRKRRNL